MTLGGKLSSEVAYDLEGKESSTITDLTLELGVGFTGGQTIRGVVEMTPMGWSFENGSIVIDEDHSETYGLGIKTAYIEAAGPYWTGGPAMVTRVGDLDLAYSPFILDTKKIDGISITGLTMGSVTMDAFYGRYMGEEDHQPAAGGRIGVTMPIAAMDAAIVKSGAEDIDYLARASVVPMSNLVINGLVAGEANDDQIAIRAEAEYGIDFLPIDVAASVGFRHTSGAFDPTFMAKGNRNPVDGEEGHTAVTAALATQVGRFGVTVDGELLGTGNDWKMDDQRAIGAAVATNFRGLDLRAGHRLTQRIEEETTTNTNETSVGVSINERALLPNLVVSASYDATVTNFSLEGMRHVARAAVGADVGAFRGVKVAGLYDSRPAEDDPSRELTVDYTAPNGVNLGYAYSVTGETVNNKVFAGVEVSF